MEGSEERDKPTMALAGLAMLAIAAAAFIASYSPVVSDDQWWHMLTGRYLLDHGQVPVADPFSFSFAGKPWVNWEWLAGVVMTSAWDRFGPLGLVVLRLLAVLTTASLLLLHQRWHQRQNQRGDGGPSWALSLLTIGLSLLVIFGRVSDRPHLLALPLLAGAHWLSMVAARRRHARAVAALLLLTGLWVLIHPSWIVGILVHCAVMADDWREHGGANSRPSRAHRLIYRASPIILLLPGLLMHPPTAYGSAVGQLFGSEGLTEWRPMTEYLSWDNFPLLAFVVLAAAWLASVALRPQQLRELKTWLLAAVLIGAIMFVRFTPLFAVLVTPALHREGSKRWTSARVPFRTTALATVLFGLLLQLAMLQAKSVFRQPFAAVVDSRANPVAAAELMGRYGLTGNVWSNGLNEQAYIAFMRYPDVKVFIDGRVPQLFSEEHLRIHSEACNSGEAFRQLLDDYPIEHVVLMEMFSEPTAALAAVLAKDPDFALVQFDDNIMLWSRRGALERVAAPPPYYAHVVPPLIGDAWFETALSAERFAGVQAELRRLLTEQPGSRIGLALTDTLARHPAATPEQRAALGALLSGPPKLSGPR